MRRDVKIGMLCGVALIFGAALLISTWPGTTLEERLARSQDESNGLGQQIEPVPEDIEEVDTNTQPPPNNNTKPDPIEKILADAAKAVEPPANRPSAAGTPRPIQHRTHIVQQGQTLSHISRIYYGSVADWEKIFNANKSTLSDPARIRPGMQLIIPD